MSGLDLYDTLQRDPAVPDVPVVFETAIPDRHARELRRRGIEHVIEKPFDLHEVLHTLHTLAPTNGGPPA